MTVSERRTKIRRQRILDYAKTLYRQYFTYRNEYLKIIDDKKSTKAQKDIAWEIYQRNMLNTFMFKYGVAMADPYGQWQKKFNKAFEEVEREFKDGNSTGTEQLDNR